MFVVQVTAQQLLLYALATVISALVQAQYITVQQVLLYALATVIPVLVLVQHITVQLMLPYVLATVMFVLALVQHLTVQQVLPYVLPPVRNVLVLVQHIAVHLLQMVPQDLIVPQRTIAVTGMVAALHPHKQSAWHAVRGKLASEYAPPIYHA